MTQIKNAIFKILVLFVRLLIPIYFRKAARLMLMGLLAVDVTKALTETPFF